VKKLTKIFLILIVSAFIIYLLTTFYLSYSAKKIVTKEVFSKIITEINTAPILPKNFKETYAKVYPGIFNKSYNTTLLNAFFKKQHSTPSDQVAAWLWMRVGGCECLLPRKLIFVGFVSAIEDNTSQEKCFEYYASHFDFTNNARGLFAASQKFFNKPLDSLTFNEQLGMILMLENPVYYNKLRDPVKFEKAIEKLKSK
jgi:hypothetical protein